MDWRLANKVEIGQHFTEFAIRSAQFASVNKYLLYPVLMLSIITSESVANSELHAERCSFYSRIRSELVASVNPAIGCVRLSPGHISRLKSRILKISHISNIFDWPYSGSEIFW